MSIQSDFPWPRDSGNDAPSLHSREISKAQDQESELSPPNQSASMMLTLISVVEQSPDVVLITEAEPVNDPGPRILYVNQAFQKMTGYAAEEVLGKTPRLLQGPNTDRAALDRIRNSLKSWQPVREELLNYRKDGTEFWADISIVPICNEKGRYTHWMAIQRDITEQRQTQRELIESRQRLHLLTEAIPQLLWTADSSGLCQFVSQSCAEFIGVSPDDCLGRGWYQFIYPEDVAPTLLKWNEAVAAGKEFVTEYRLRRKDREYLWFLHRAVPRFDANGQIAEWMGTSTEIEFKKRSEQALRQTEKLAVVGRLASSIAHEINNPLASVMNLVYLLSSNPSLDLEAREYVKTAQEELQRISEVATQALRFHKQSTAPSPTAISELLDSVLALYRRRILNRELQVECEYEPSEPLICRSGDIRQAIANIIGNAIDAASHGTRLRIRLGNRRNPNNDQPGLRITISDAGHGMTPATINRIFEPFFTTKGDTGTGLGLWIAKDLIALHGGTISVKSSTIPGRSGTTFSIFLPYQP
jgi:PAS domain S-box-containing protein